ncbi:TonB-dependent siderophore receptor [Paracoccus amoyensis]|nr:TonB-dependent siderophore receptor [Paracoccus amoyensis]
MRRRSHLSLILFRTTALVALGLPMQATAQEGTAEEPYVLAPITLRAGQQYTGAIDGYLATSTATGLKSGAPLTEIPQSVSVVTSEELQDRAPTNVDEAVAYVPGVTSGIWGVDDRYDQFLIRGFDLGTSGIYRDGLSSKAQNFTGFVIDPYMIERIDVLRGPASVVYGSNDAAGMINIITKRPVFDQFAEAQLSYGSHDTASIGLDAGGALDKDKTLAWRLTALKRDGASEIEGSEDDRDMVALGLTWEPTDRTSVTLLGHWQKDDRTPNVFLPVAGEDYPASYGDLPYDFTDSQHDFNRFATEQTSIGWQARHDLTEQLTLRQNFRYARQRTDYRHLYFNGMHDPDWNPTEDSMNYAAFAVDEVARHTALDNQIEYRSKLAGGDNTLLFGADYVRQEVDGTSAYDASYQIDIRNPSYDFDVTYPAIYQNSRTVVTEKGVYLQDHLKLQNGVSVTAGLRRAWVENKAYNRLTDSTARQKDTATTGLLGLTYDMGNGFVPYASYTESFTTNIGQKFDGSQFEPTEGKQYEVGLRYVPTDGNMMLSAALFEITKTNVLTSDPDHPQFSIQTGEVRHRGLELEARGALSDRFSLIAGYTYLDPKITRSQDGDEGNLTARAPRHQASLWMDYDFQNTMDGLSLGGGLRYIGSSYGDNGNTRQVASYTLVDMAVHYEWDDYTVALNVNNVLDKEYYATCDTSVGCISGAGRNATLTLSRSF